MEYIVKRNERVFLINTTPKDRIFATVIELMPRKATGILANFLKEYSGQEQYTYDEIVIDADELPYIVTELLGWKFSRARAWKELCNWAHFKIKAKRNNTLTEQ
jgi:hypothetical protein